jgi:maltose alpha-D-glucosyltransferase/alpha-amylase
LYGTIPDQLKDKTSFARKLSAILAKREELQLAKGELIDVPDVSHPGMLVMVQRLPSDAIAVTVLNFTGEDISGTVNSTLLTPGAEVTDAFSGETLNSVDDLRSFYVDLPAFTGSLLVLRQPAPKGGE